MAIPSRSIAQIADSLNWFALEAMIHRDPGGRGLAGFRRAGAPLDAGQLKRACLDLAVRGARVAILTGFCVRLAERVTAETDGPPGALYLARVLTDLGIASTLVTDRRAVDMVRRGAEWLGLPGSCVWEFPDDGEASCATSTAWVDEFFSRPSPAPWTHLVAIERPGPSHTLDSFLAQRRDVVIPIETFEAAVPEHDRDICHTMLGESIESDTARTHLLFEAVAERKLPITTVGIGDGGNELGMGQFLWEDLVAAIATGPAGKIACRVAADFALLGGTSNWGAYALALATARLRGQRVDDQRLFPAGQQQLLEVLVAAGAVDGRTRRAEATVDGLTPADYSAPLAEMLALLAV